MDNKNNTYSEILKKLTVLRRKKKKVRILHGCTFFIAAALLILNFLVIFETLFWPQAVVRVSLLAVAAIFLSVLFAVKIIYPLFSLFFLHNTPPDDDLAHEAGRIYGQKDRIVNALQIYRDHLSDSRKGTSPLLANAALNKIYESTKNIDFAGHVKFKLRKTEIVLFAGSFIIVCFMFFANISMAKAAFLRISRPFGTYKKPAPFNILVSPGNIEVVEGDDIELKAEIVGKKINKAVLCIKKKNSTDQTIDLVRPFKYTLFSINKSIKYWFEAGSVKTDMYTISVKKRPVVRNLSVRLIPPSYTRLYPQVLEDNTGSFTALFGTRVFIEILSSKDLRKADIVFSSGGSKPMKIKGETKAAVYFKVVKKENYFISIQDTEGIKNLNPITYEIDVKEDLFPTAHIIVPGRDMDLDESMHMDLKVEGEDDFGISVCRLKYRIFSAAEYSDSTLFSSINIPIEKENPAHLLRNVSWDLDTLNLFPGDVVSYFFEVFDNDAVKGPKHAASRKYSARFPSMFEIFASAEQKESGFADTLKSVLDRSKEMSEALSVLSDELKTKKSLSWEQKQQLKNITEKQKKASDEVEDLSRKIEALARELEKQNLLNPETIKKYEELNKLFNEISSPELRKALEKLSKAVDKSGNVEMSLSDFQQAQKNFEAAIDRTLSLLKEIQAEQKIESLIKLAEDIEKRQNSVNQSIEQNVPLSNLVKREELISKDTRNLNEEIDKASEFLKKSHPQASDSLSKASSFIKMQKIPERQEAMKTSMAKKQRSKSLSLGRESKKSLQQLSSMLKQARKSLKRYRQKQIAGAIRRASQNLLTLSKMQEALSNMQKSGSERSTAGSQLSLISGLKQVTDSLMQVSRKTFAISYKLGKSLKEAHSEMNRALSFLQQGKYGMMKASQKRAVASLNKAVISLQQSKNRMNSRGGESGSSLDDFMQQLESMGNQQAAINRATSDLLNRGRLTLKQQAAMARLAEKQSALQRIAQQIAEQLRDRSDVLGNLDKISEDMKKVADELKDGSAGKETKRRQERILSRLLDAQKSIHRQDFSRRRQSDSGKDFIRKSPAKLNLQTLKNDDKLRQDIISSAKEQYSEEYLKLIKEYLKAIIRQQEEVK